MLQLGPALMAGNGAGTGHAPAGHALASIGPGTDGREWRVRALAGRLHHFASIGPGTDGREWLVQAALEEHYALVQLGPALVAGEGARGWAG